MWRVGDLHQPQQALGVAPSSEQVRGAAGARGPRERSGDRGRGRGERRGRGSQRAEHGGRLVAPVAAVRLVGALAGEHDLHVLGGEARELRERRGGRDAAGLLEARDGGRQLGQEAPLNHLGVPVLGADQAGALGRGLSLVEQAAVAGEADRERRGRPRGALGHRRHDRRGVDAPGQEGAVRDVGHHLALDRVGKALGEVGGEVVVGEVAVGLTGRLAPGVHPRRPVLLDYQGRGGGQLADPREQGARRRDEATGQVVVEGDAVHGWLDHAGREQGADLGGDGHAPAVAPPVQRLDAELVAGGHQAPAAVVPEHEGEHAVQLAHAVGTALFVCVHDRLAVGAGGVAMAASLELRPQRDVVVDLGVGDQGDRAVLGLERLVAARHVDDRQAGVGEGHRADAPHRVPIGPAVPQPLDHPLGGVGAPRTGRIENGSDPAHAQASWQASMLSLLRDTPVWIRAPAPRRIDLTPSTTQEVDRCTA